MNSHTLITGNDIKELGLNYGLAIAKELDEYLRSHPQEDRRRFLLAMFTLLTGQVAKQIGPHLTVEMLQALVELTPKAVRLIEAERQHQSTGLN
jgi:hypothetical protein